MLAYIPYMDPMGISESFRRFDGFFSQEPQAIWIESPWGCPLVSATSGGEPEIPWDFDQKAAMFGSCFWWISPDWVSQISIWDATSMDVYTRTPYQPIFSAFGVSDICLAGDKWEVPQHDYHQIWWISTSKTSPKMGEAKSSSCGLSLWSHFDDHEWCWDGIYGTSYGLS